MVFLNALDARGVVTRRAWDVCAAHGAAAATTWRGGCRSSDLASVPVDELVPLVAGGLVAAPRHPASPQRLDGLEGLALGWLGGHADSLNTHAAYRRAFADWLSWCARHGVEPLTAGIHHADAYRVHLTSSGLARSTVAQRLSALTSFYRYALAQQAITSSGFFAVRRPKVNDSSTTTGLTKDEVRALLAAAAADSPRSLALVTLLTHNGYGSPRRSPLRSPLTYDQGHRCSS